MSRHQFPVRHLPRTFSLPILSVLTTHSYAGVETKLISLAVDRTEELNTDPYESAVLVSAV
jgi:hypothetical protein